MAGRSWLTPNEPTLLQWGHSGDNPGWLSPPPAAAGPGCLFTRRQGCPHEGSSIQSITSHSRLFSPPAMETASLYKPC